MEGYSVTEAASILGVPTERVWELLARGVLSGAAEGETGMRVYLQPRPAPAPPAPDPGRPNGDGAAREPERELSPFRELLTEFRNLTERYGQALLALGEARGEVAALRSRVDLLEARMDLRLPMSAPASWPAPMPQREARAVAAPRPPDVTLDDESDTVPDVDTMQDPDEDRPSRRRRQRRATENFAEALARAEDPTRPELPGAAETAAALAALRADGGAETRGPETRGPEGSLPRELPAADSIPMAEEPALERAPAADRSDQPSEDRAEAPATEPSEPTASAEGSENEAGPDDDVSDARDAEVGAEEVAAEPDGEPEPDLAAAQEPETDAEPPPAPRDAPPITWDPERYSVDIGEPDWYAEDETPASSGAAEPSASTGVAEPPARAVEPGPSADDAGDPGAYQSAAATTEPEAPPDVEERVQWSGGPAEDQPATDVAATEADTGADEMEVVGSQPTPDAEAGDEPDVMAVPTPRALPGSRELDEALAALDALAGRTRSVDSGARAWPAAHPVPHPPAAEAQPRPVASGRVGEAPRLAATPASRAYRRLRRIFPG